MAASLRYSQPRSRLPISVAIRTVLKDLAARLVLQCQTRDCSAVHVRTKRQVANNAVPELYSPRIGVKKHTAPKPDSFLRSLQALQTENCLGDHAEGR